MRASAWSSSTSNRKIVSNCLSSWVIPSIASAASGWPESTTARPLPARARSVKTSTWWRLSGPRAGPDGSMGATLLSSRPVWEPLGASVRVVRAGLLQQRAAEEADDPSLVLVGVGLQPLDVPRVVDLPDLGAGADEALVQRVHGLAVAAVRGPDEQR